MNPSRSKQLALSIVMMSLALFVAMIVSNSVLSREIKLFLVPSVSILVCLPFIGWFFLQAKRQSDREERELEAKYAAQDAELFGRKSD